MKKFLRYLISCSLLFIISLSFVNTSVAIEKGGCKSYYPSGRPSSECCMFKDGVPDLKVWGLNDKPYQNAQGEDQWWCGGPPASAYECYCQRIKNDSSTGVDAEAKEAIKESDPLTYTPEVSIPGEGSPITAGKTVTVPANTQLLADYIIAIFKYSTGIVGIIAAIVIMMGGVRWLTAAGGAGVSEAKTMIISGISGLALTLGSFLLLSTINTSLVNFKVQPVKQITKIDLFQFGCCEKINSDDSVTTENLKDIDCRALKGFKATTFRYGYKADANECKPDEKKQACCEFGWYKENTLLNDNGPQVCINELMASDTALADFRAKCTEEASKLDDSKYNTTQISIKEGKKCHPRLSQCE